LDEEINIMIKKTMMLLTLGCLTVLMAACLPGSADPAAPYYPTYTAIAQGLIDLANTATAQSAQSVLPAESPTPPPPVGGTENVQQPDGTTKYSDYDAGFEMILPAGWIGVRPGAQEFNDVLKSEGAKNEALQTRMTLDKDGYEPVKDRYYIYATKPDQTENSLFAYGKLAWDVSDSKVIDQNTLGDLVQSLEMSQAMPGLRVVSSNVVTNGNGVPVIVIGANWTAIGADGSMTPLYINMLIFKPTDNSTARLVVTSPKEARAVIGPDIEPMVQSIKRVGQ
jgi:hypothetical protein